MHNKTRVKVYLVTDLGYCTESLKHALNCYPSLHLSQLPPLLEGEKVYRVTDFGHCTKS